MTYLLIPGFLLIGACMAWALCRVGGRADERAERALTRMENERRAA